MPLNKIKLKQEIKNLSATMRQKTEIADDEYADKLATIIDNYVKSGDIIVQGIVTAGSAATQTQTAPVNIKIK